MRGGDGYSANPFQPIGGMMSYPRYGNNYRPVFNGELLHNGGTYKKNKVIKNSNNKNKTNNNNKIGGKKNCGCNKKSEPSIFNLIKKQSGGNGAPITQVSAISEVGKMLTPLKVGALVSVIMVIFLYHYTNKKPRKGVQMGGYASQLENILAPLGKNNLLVLASLMLLHHFAVINSKQKTNIRRLKRVQSGGNIINSILSTLFNYGKKDDEQIQENNNNNNNSNNNTNSNSNNNNNNNGQIVIETINNSFKNNVGTSQYQQGGSILKSYVKQLGGGKAFYANSIFKLLENIFSNKINEMKNVNNKEMKMKFKNNIVKKNNKLFYILSPISFNIYGSEDTVQKIFNELKTQKGKK